MNICISRHCCGLYEVMNFYDNTKGSIEQYFQVFLSEIPSKFEALNSTRGFMATTISSQRGAVAWLKSKGFKPIKTFTNPGTGRKVTLWFTKGPLRAGDMVKPRGPAKTKV